MRAIGNGEPRALGSLSRLATAAVVAAAGRYLGDFTPRGRLDIEVPDGRRFRFEGEPDLEAAVAFRSLKPLFNGVRRGQIGFAQSYIDRDIEADDLTTLLRFFLRNEARFEALGRGIFRVRLPDRLYHLMRDNSKRQARRNIEAHYDLSNEFYARWLDPGMTYSSAYFEDGANDLETAQREKYRRIAEAADLRAGDRVLEIGCGWGGFAETAAGEHDTHVRGITLSPAQLSYAQARLSKAGLDGRARLELRDYRDTAGTFDRIVSIEMIEAVGEAHWPTYFRTLSDRLKTRGTVAIQAITIGEPFFEGYRQGVDFIQRYIFPGGMLPTKTIIAEEARKAGLAVDGVDTFGQSYVRTLQEWRSRFEAAWPEISKLGFDETFRRKWEYYLSYCEAGFAEKVIDVGIYRLVKA
ncbi:SAM-dependent methyltransferase [Lutibaculum baratangense]|nr:cyclopropane-fatty-acyl-phospholipid synthase family protein [Lutibaculum baratangense]